MNLAIVGCGYVADGYATTLRNYPELVLRGVYDRNTEYSGSFARLWQTKCYASLAEILADPAVDLVLNLTNPRSHFDVTRQCLEAGKHVYSEKPLAMTADAARQLVQLADRKGVYLSSAPCSVLGEAAQTIHHALNANLIGRVRLIYANFDDGMIAPKLAPWNWRNERGIPWPAKDEFEVGCTYEHAGYVLTWLAAYFGSALRVRAFATCLVPDKGIGVETMAPDFAVGCIEYGEGIVARVTCGLAAPVDKSLTIIGDDGVISVADVRNDICPVYVRRIPPQGWRASLERRVNALRKRTRIPGWEKNWQMWSKLPLAQTHRGRFVNKSKLVDFCRGPAEMAAAIRDRRRCRLSAELGWHIAELIERIQYPGRFADRPELTSTFCPFDPLPALH